MPEGVCTQVKALPLTTTCSFGQWPIESDLNTDSIDIWFAIFWKDMEVPFEVKLEEKPCRKECFDGKWRMTVYNWIKVKLLYYSRIK